MAETRVSLDDEHFIAAAPIDELLTLTNAFDNATGRTSKTLKRKT